MGIEVRRKFYGSELPFKATRALLPFLRKSGLRKILITFPKGKRSIRKVCEQLGGAYLDTIESSTTDRQLDRFTLDL